MADIENLLPGDHVVLVFLNETMPARVIQKNKRLVMVEVERDKGQVFKWVSPKKLRLIKGGKRQLEKQANTMQAAIDFARAYSVGPKRLREVFEREKAAGNITMDFEQLELQLAHVYGQTFLKGKKIL